MNILKSYIVQLRQRCID